MVIIQLKQLLSDIGMTQTELAKATGIRPSTICELYNNNAAFIKLENLYKICNYLDCEISDILKLKKSE